MVYSALLAQLGPELDRFSEERRAKSYDWGGACRARQNAHNMSVSLNDDLCGRFYLCVYGLVSILTLD